MAMHIGHVGLQVTDPDRSGAFAKQVLGLTESPARPGELLLTANEKHHELQLIAADVPRFDHVGLEVETEAELWAVGERVLAAGGVKIDDHDPGPGLGKCLRFSGPAGIEYEIYTDMTRTPLGVESHLKPLIRRLGHLTFLSTDAEAILAFWLDGLSFRLSDQFEGMSWTRCDADHHGLAVGPREFGTVLHHHAWEVQDLGALGAYCDQLALDDLALLWGPVRHGPGFNLATYLPDLDGGAVEVYSDLMRIDDEAAYRAVDWSTQPRALNLWGPGPGEDLLEVGIAVERCCQTR
jgi:catechol 2,3-dioxygenase